MCNSRDTMNKQYKHILSSFTAVIISFILLSTAASAYQPAICMLRDAYTNVLDYSSPDVGQGYAKMSKQRISTVDEARNACTESDYTHLLQAYCAYPNNNSVQMEFSFWHPEGESDILSQGCGNFGCEYISCHSTVPSVNNNNNTSNTTSSTQNTDYLLKFKEYQLRNSAGKRMISAGECQISSLNKDCFQYNNQNRSIIQGGDNTKNAFLNNSLNPTNSTNSSNTTTSQLITTISPVNGTSLNNSFAQINVSTSTPAVCKWDKQDLSQNNMANNFTQSNNTFSNAIINNLVLGENNIFIACNNQTSADNTDLTYFVQNILDNSQLIGQNTINNSIALNSSINQSVISSSNIYNSTITSSTIVNSSIIHAIINNANITNNIISTGEISVNNIFYNATSRGSANLSQLNNFAPIADFVISASNTRLDDAITFTSTSIDANIGSALNDALTYFWDFGDGTNSTLSSFSKKYSSLGLFVVSLTVKDKFNSTSNKTRIVTVDEGITLSNRKSKNNHEEKQIETSEPIVEKKESIQKVSMPEEYARETVPETQKNSQDETQISSNSTARNLNIIKALIFLITVLSGLTAYSIFILAKQIMSKRA